MDDEDWTGTPPEGRYSRDRARPEFWRSQQWQLGVAGAVILAGVIVLVVVLATR